MKFGLGERIVMAQDWVLRDAEHTLLAKKGEAGTVRGFWPDRKGGDPVGYGILLDSGQELGVYPKAIEPEP